MNKVLNNELFSDYIKYKEMEAVNFHTLLEVWNYSLYHNNNRLKEETDSMIIGQIMHMFLLENIDLNDLVLVMPKLDKRKKEDKIIYEEIISKSEKEYKYIIDEETHQNILNMYDSFHNILNNFKELYKIKEAISFGQKEYTILYDRIIDNNKIPVKSRLDCIHNNVIVDLKTTINASPQHFVNDIKKYSYDLQLTFYAYGISLLNNIDINELELYIVAIEKFVPYDMSFYKVEIKQDNLIKIENMFRKYIYQKNNPKYSGYEKTIISI